MDEEIDRIDKCKEYYKFENMIFTSKSVFDIIESIDKNLKYLSKTYFTGSDLEKILVYQIKKSQKNLMK